RPRAPHGRAVDASQLDLAGEPVRAVLQFLVPESPLPCRYGTYLYRRASPLCRHEALLGDSAATHTTWRTCRRHVRSGVSAGSLRPVGVALEVRPAAAARRAGFRAPRLPEYREPLSDTCASFSAPGNGRRVGGVPGRPPGPALVSPPVCWPPVLSTYCDPWDWR